VREGSALLQGLAACGHCGRRLHTHYRGRSYAPGYHCPGKVLVEGRGVYCLNVGGVQIDEAVTRAFLAALEPAKLAATVAAAERLEADNSRCRAIQRGDKHSLLPQPRQILRQGSRQFEPALFVHTRAEKPTRGREGTGLAGLIRHFKPL
jgi:hypothetical protein